jgi:hypothetical protein
MMLYNLYWEMKHPFHPEFCDKCGQVIPENSAIDTFQAIMET